MPERQLAILSPLGGVRYDVTTSYMDRVFATDIANMDLFGPELCKRPGKVSIGNALSEAFLINCPLTMLQTKVLSDRTLTVVFTDKSIYKLTSHKHWLDIKGSFAWNPTLRKRPVAFTYLDRIIAVGLQNPIIEWNGLASTFTEVAIPGNLRAKYACPYMSRILYFNVIDNNIPIPQRVVWTDIGTSYNITSGYSGFADLVETPGDIQTACLLSRFLVVYKTDSIWVINYYGGEQVFGFEIVVPNIGVVSPYAVVSLRDRQIFLSTDNIYEFTGSPTPRPIGDQIVRKLIDESNKEYLDTSYAFAFGKLLYFCIPMNHEYPDTVFVYDTLNPRWSIYPIEAMFLTNYYGYDSKTIGDFAGQPLSVLAGKTYRSFRTSSLIPKISGATSTGQIYYLDPNVYNDGDTAIYGMWTSSDIVSIVDEKVILSRWRSIEVESKQGSITIEYSTNEGLTWTSPEVPTLIFGESFEFKETNIDVESTSLRIRLTNNNMNERMFVRSIIIHYLGDVQV